MSACAASVIADCTALASLINPSVLEGAAKCLSAADCGGGDPIQCLASACDAEVSSCLQAQLVGALEAGVSTETVQCLSGASLREGGASMDTGVVDVPSVDTLPPPETGAPEAPAGDSGGDANTEAGCAMGAPCGTTCCSAGEVCVGGSCQQDQPCTVASDCSSGCCAPATDSAGHPLGPYVCKPNDANPYDCCYGLFNSCGNGFCCVQDNNSNEFCAAPCTMNSDCAPAKCDPFMFSITHTTCPGPTACGP